MKFRCGKGGRLLITLDFQPIFKLRFTTNEILIDVDYIIVNLEEEKIYSVVSATAACSLHSQVENLETMVGSIQPGGEKVGKFTIKFNKKVLSVKNSWILFTLNLELKRDTTVLDKVLFRKQIPLKIKEDKIQTSTW